MVACETEKEIEELWAKLEDRGEILMDLSEYPFSPKYGWLNDRCGTLQIIPTILIFPKLKSY